MSIVCSVKCPGIMFQNYQHILWASLQPQKTRPSSLFEFSQRHCKTYFALHYWVFRTTRSKRALIICILSYPEGNALNIEFVEKKNNSCTYILGLVNLFFDHFMWTHFWNFYDSWLHLGKVLSFVMLWKYGGWKHGRLRFEKKKLLLLNFNCKIGLSIKFCKQWLFWTGNFVTPKAKIKKSSGVCEQQLVLNLLVDLSWGPPQLFINWSCNPLLLAQS